VIPPVTIIAADGSAETVSAEEFRRRNGVEACRRCGTPWAPGRNGKHSCSDGRTATPEQIRAAFHRAKDLAVGRYHPQSDGVEGYYPGRSRTP
jgi:hypothetical protein